MTVQTHYCQISLPILGKVIFKIAYLGLFKNYFSVGWKNDNLNIYKKRIHNILSVILNFGIWWVVFFKSMINKYFSTELFLKNLENEYNVGRNG